MIKMNLYYKYLSQEHLKGFNNYKYSAIDTSPLSNYVMHPLWNISVKVLPKWIAPNLITFVGFLFLLADVLVLTVLDYHYRACSYRPDGQYGIPNWLFIVIGVFLFINYNLDGIDGKQARKIGVSGPLGELFDHGLDSYVVFFIPYCLISVFGRDEFSTTPFRAYLAVLSIVMNFYVSHCEKYNTGTLYLPWGYDVSMWVSTLIFIIPGIYGPEVYKLYLTYNLTLAQGVEIAIHLTGIFTTLPVAVYNIYLHRKMGKGKKLTLFGAIRPMIPLVVTATILTSWGLLSPNNIMDKQLRPFLFLLGTLFSNIACRLIVAQMSNQLCDLINWMTWPLLAGVAISMLYPTLEYLTLYVLLVSFLVMHIHYGVCVVRQMCDHFRISCFTVPKDKVKSKK